MEMEQGQFSFSKHISILYRCGQSYYDDVLREYGIGCGQQFFLLRISQLPGISLLEVLTAVPRRVPSKNWRSLDTFGAWAIQMTGASCAFT